MGHGGRRAGAGRPETGRYEDLTYPKLDGFNIQAVRSLKHRVPPDTHPELAKLADYAFMRIVAVMDEKVPEQHETSVLKAASMIRDEICGPIVKKIELKMGLAEMLALASKDDDTVDALPAFDEETVLDLLPDPEAREKAPTALTAAGAGDDGA